MHHRKDQLTVAVVNTQVYNACPLLPLRTPPYEARARNKRISGGTNTNPKRERGSREAQVDTLQLGREHTLEVWIDVEPTLSLRGKRTGLRRCWRWGKML
jgi:hypothetical protein